MASNRFAAHAEPRYRDALPLAADVFCEVVIATVRGHLISPSEIAENIGRGTPNSVNVTLHRLVKRGLIENKGHRRWVLP